MLYRQGEGLPHDLSGRKGPESRAADHAIWLRQQGRGLSSAKVGFVQKSPHRRRSFPPSVIEAAVMIRQTGLVSARFGVADDGEILHQAKRASSLTWGPQGVNQWT